MSNPGDPASQIAELNRYKRHLREETSHELSRFGAGKRFYDTTAQQDVWVASNIAAVFFKGEHGGHLATFGGNHEVQYLNDGINVELGTIPAPGFTDDELLALSGLPLADSSTYADDSISLKVRL